MSPDIVKMFNKCLKKKVVKNRSGRVLSKAAEVLLATSDFSWAYVEINGVTNMLESEAVELGFINDRDWLAALKNLKQKSA